jgi:hypothetical protein
MPLALTFTGSLTITTCWCGIAHAIPADLYRYAENHKGFEVSCPLGHKWVFTETETERQRKRADALERQLRTSREATQWERDQRLASERSNTAYRGWITRYRNRIAAGVCPVDDCRRNFQNVQRHIERMHPTWAHDHPEALT